MKNDVLISANALKQFIRENGVVYSNKLDKFVVEDAVRVVRCKDCRYWDCGVCKLYSEEPDQYSSGLKIEMFSDDFCSYGERRNNNDSV